MSQSRLYTQNPRLVRIPAGRTHVEGALSVPPAAEGLVLFAHGSGSGRHSPRNQYVAGVLQQHQLATLLFDLLDEDEAEDRAKVFDIGLLAERLGTAAAWVRQQAELASLPLGFFGASTGAAAALVAAAEPGCDVRAVVSRGGRPDLAMDVLPLVRAPTLLIVGGEDEPVLSLNRQALARLQCPKELVIVPGATHLFSEPGALEEVARLAADWFSRYLVGTAAEPSPP